MPLIGTALLLAHVSAPTLPELNDLAKSRNVEALTALLDSKPAKRSPFQVLRTGGAYGVGRYGWTVLPLNPKGNARHFYVFSTPLTSEDTGELLFEQTPHGLHYIPEEATMGVRVLHHQFTVSFQLAEHDATLADQVTLDSGNGGLAFLRMGPQYRVDSIDGKSNFVQSGGVIALSLARGRHTLALKYHAKVYLPQYAASVTENEATLTNDYWYPMVAREPAPYDITIHTPAAWFAVGQGELVKQTKDADGNAFTYHMGLPVVYYSLTAGPFKPFSREIGGRRYSVWSQAMTDVQKGYQTEFYAPIINFYSKTFSPIPFSGYGAVVSKSYGGGALEAYSFATYGTGWLPAEDAHEPSHTWWGGIVPNTYLHSFWNESFADYSMRLFARNSEVGNTQERAMAFVSHPEVNNAWNASSLEDGGVDIGPPADALGYGKGSFVLDALETELGTESMEATLRQWVKNTKPGDSGEWSDYERAAAQASGQDLTWFFDQWARRPGYPALDVTNARFEGGKVRLDVAYKGLPYRMTAEVLLQFADGSQALERAMIPASENSVIEVPAKEKPALVSFDPYRRLVRAFDPSEAPPMISRSWGEFTRYALDAVPSGLNREDHASPLPTDLNGAAIIGMPGESPVLDKLAAKVGFVLAGNSLTFDGTTIDLNHNAAMALVDLGGGKRCLIALGRPDLPPNTGDAWLALTDHLGRFLRGKTLPKTSGRFVFSL